jgi:putative transposase
MTKSKEQAPAKKKKSKIMHDRVRPNDRVIIEGVAHRVVRPTMEGWVIAAGNADPVILTRERLDRDEDAGLIKIERVNVYGQHVLSKSVRLDLRIKEIWFNLVIEAHKAGEFAGCGNAAMVPFIEKHKETVKRLVADWLRDAKASPQPKKRKTQVGQKLPDTVDIDVTVSPKTISRYLEKYKETGNILVARKRTENCNKGGLKVSSFVKSEIRRIAKEHSAENRPTIRGAWMKIRASIDEHNKRMPEELHEIRPDVRTVGRHIAALPEAMKYAGRHGAKAEYYNFGPFNEGPMYTRVGELVEADFWDVPLYLWLKHAKVLDELPDDLADDLLSTRIYVFALVDKTTGYIPSIAFSLTENSHAAIQGLRRAVSDKSRFALWAGATSEWLHFGYDHIVTDAGPAFNSDDFHTTASAMGGHTFAASGLPHLRGLIESIFSTLHKGFISEFIGRAFNDVVDAGDYKGQARASMGLEAFLAQMVRYVVDIYNNKLRDDGLRRSPMREVQALASSMDVKLPPSQDQLTVYFGIEHPRQMTAEGVVFQNIRYDNQWLVSYRRDVGLVDVQIRVDEENLGWISVEIDGDWLTVAALDVEFQGVPLAEWLAFKEHLRITFAAEDEIDFRKHVGPALRDIVKAIRTSEREMGLERQVWTEDRLAAHEEQSAIRIVNNAAPLTPGAPTYGNAGIGTHFPANTPPLPASDKNKGDHSGDNQRPTSPARRPLKLRKD